MLLIYTFQKVKFLYISIFHFIFFYASLSTFLSVSKAVKYAKQFFYKVIQKFSFPTLCNKYVIQFIRRSKMYYIQRYSLNVADCVHVF